ncbi:MAG: thioredoxin family protein [Nitrososphaerales archaeon]
MRTINLNSETWESVENSKLPVAVDFWAPWSSYCKELAPLFEELAKEYEGKALFAKLNIYESPDIADKYGIKQIPVIKIFCDGKEISEFVGFAPKELLKEFIDRAIVAELTCLR